MFIVTSTLKSYAISTITSLSLVNYTILFYIAAVIILVGIGLFTGRVLAEDVPIAGVSEQSTSMTNKPHNTTPAQVSYFSSPQDTHVAVNGHEIPASPNGDVHATVPVEGGQVTINNESHSSTSQESSSVQTKTDIRVHVSSPDVTIEDSQ